MKTIALLWLSLVSLEFRSSEESDISASDLAPKSDYIDAWTDVGTLENGNVLHIQYKCSNDSVIFVNVEVKTESQKNVEIFKKFITCLPFDDKKLITIELKYARYITFKPGIYNKYSVFVDTADVKIWMVDQNKKWIRFERSTVKKDIPLKVIPPFERPDIILDKCYAWWFVARDKIPYVPTCPKEDETVQVLSYPMALDGGRTGLVKAFQPYTSKALDKVRSKNIKNSNFSVAFWLYIVDYCPRSTHCSLMHHGTWYDEHLAPLFLMNNEGQIHVEIKLKNKETIAFLTLPEFSLPKKEWVQLVFSCQASNIWMMYMKTRSEQQWKMSKVEIPSSAIFYHDDVEGIYYFGGSELQPSFRGYFGEITFFRRRLIDPTKTKLDPKSQLMFIFGLKERDEKCRLYKNKLSFIKLQARSLYETVVLKKSCPSFWKWLEEIINAWKHPQCKMVNAPKLTGQYEFVKKSIQRWIFTKQKGSFPDVATLLLNEAYKILDEKGLDGVPEVISLLKQSSCYDNHDASFMLATILNYGLFMGVNINQSHSYLLTGSIYSNRLCLLSLANKHVFGLDGIPEDYEQAYVYYMTVAYLTNNDLANHDDRDILTESVRLTDEVTVKAQTSEEEDLFLWLKHQASRGITDAQKKLASMLYWGSQGVNRNKSSASTYYEAAASSGDATSLYDYGILLLKGHGVKKNITKALEYFKMAAEKKHAQAINTLGWYALVYKVNYTEAADYFEEAFKLGNPDAGHNLAYMIMNGKFPDLKRSDKVLAWDFFSKAALGGNFDSGLLVAKYNMVGHPRTVRTPALSIDWARYLAEQNPAIGKLLKNGLVSFRRRNWPTALVYYLMAASTGMEVANFNLAFLCEENYEYLTSFMQKECTWRHYNLSSLRSSKSSNPYAWLKMADYHYMNHNLSYAAITYAEAAAKGDPQGYFSLATMVENNDKVPDHALKTVGMSFSTSRNTEELLYQLYSKCRNSRKSEAYIPCSIALWRIKLYYFWNRHGTKLMGIMFIVLTMLSVLIRMSYFQASNHIN